MLIYIKHSYKNYIRKCHRIKEKYIRKHISLYYYAIILFLYLV
jgi:hypothetical protein